jgi:hypothetical protein
MILFFWFLVKTKKVFKYFIIYYYISNNEVYVDCIVGHYAY